MGVVKMSFSQARVEKLKFWYAVDQIPGFDVVHIEDIIDQDGLLVTATDYIPADFFIAANNVHSCIESGVQV